MEDKRMQRIPPGFAAAAPEDLCREGHTVPATKRTFRRERITVRVIHKREDQENQDQNITGYQAISGQP